MGRDGLRPVSPEGNIKPVWELWFEGVLDSSRVIKLLKLREAYWGLFCLDCALLFCRMVAEGMGGEMIIAPW